MPLPADDDSLPFQRWIVQFFHGDEERIHVDVEDGAGESRDVGGRGHDGRILAAAVISGQPGCWGPGQ